MNAGFFALAFTAAFNPKLLALDLLLIENRRPRAMFVCVLASGLTVALTIGLLDVLAIHADAISAQKTASAGVELALGLLLLAAGALVATGRLHGRRTEPVPAGGGKPGMADNQKKDSWAARALAEPRLGLAMLAGAVIGLPGIAYLTALHNLVTGHYPTATQIAAVAAFVLIELLLIIIPFVFVEVRPAATKAFLTNAQQWLAGHARQVIAATALILGAYLTISALIRRG